MTDADCKRVMALYGVERLELGHVTREWPFWGHEHDDDRWCTDPTCVPAFEEPYIPSFEIEGSAALKLAERMQSHGREIFSIHPPAVSGDDWSISWRFAPLLHSAHGKTLGEALLRALEHCG